MRLPSFRKAARRARVGMLVVPTLVGACNSPTDGGVMCTDILLQLRERSKPILSPVRLPLQ